MWVERKQQEIKNTFQCGYFITLSSIANLDAINPNISKRLDHLKDTNIGVTLKKIGELFEQKNRSWKLCVC